MPSSEVFMYKVLKTLLSLSQKESHFPQALFAGCCMHEEDSRALPSQTPSGSSIKLPALAERGSRLSPLDV